MGRVNHQAGKRLFFISFLFLTIFVLLVSPVSSLEKVMDKDCTINDEVFDRDWKKYSDMENTPLTFKEHPLTARSWETQQYYATQSEIVDAELQIFFLKRDMEIDRLMRLELKEYKKALVSGHRKNLLKSFCRLSYYTAATMYKARLVGKSIASSFVNLMTTTSSVSAVGSTLKILTDGYYQLNTNSLAFADNTQSTTEATAWGTFGTTLSAFYETLESLGDPKKIGVAVFSQMSREAEATLPSATLSEEEVEILRAEHLKNEEISKTIAKSYKVNLERNNKVKELEVRIKELKIELAKREAKEKNRVRDLLVDNCKDREKEEEAEDEECDCEHLCLCDNENDCMTTGGYWYDDQCNECPEEDTSAGEFNCPIPAGAEHIVTDTEDYWIMDGKNVGPYHSWYVYSEKTEKEAFACYDAEGKLYGVDKLWRKDGTLEAEYNHKTGVGKMWHENGMLRWEYNHKTGVYKWWYDNGTLEYEWNYKDDKKHGICKGWDKSGKLKYECNYKEGKCVGCVLGQCE